MHIFIFDLDFIPMWLLQTIIVLWIVGTVIWAWRKGKDSIVGYGIVILVLILCLQILMPLTKVAINCATQRIETYEEYWDNTKKLNYEK